MVRGLDELERPSEWLRVLREDARGYAELLEQSGDWVKAAYRLAAARCRTRDRATAVPTAREVHAALHEIAKTVEDEDRTPIPSVATLATDCDEIGLLVIR